MHEDMQVSSKNLCQGHFIRRGSRLVKFPWQSSNFLNSQKKGANHAPRSSVHNLEIFACARKVFANFCLNCGKNCVWPRP